MSDHARGIQYPTPPAPEDTPVRRRPPAIAGTLEREAAQLGDSTTTGIDDGTPEVSEANPTGAAPADD